MQKNKLIGPLLKSGAGNPIGNLRIKEAYVWLQDHFPTVKPRGFSLSEIIERKEDFIESFASYGLFVAGSSGIQGEWPKLLLTQGYDGFFYLDHSLPDQLAAKHWLVKFSRGNDQKLEKILLHEAIDMKIARYLGLRVLKDLELHQRTLFIPRFDRQIIKAMRQTIRRWHLHLMCNRELSNLSAIFNPILQGWQQYYGRFYGSGMSAIWQHMNAYLIRWMRRKYKNLDRHKRRARYALGRLARDFPNAFVHWKMGVG